MMSYASTEPAVNVGDLRQKITELVAHNAVAMVQCAIDGVMEEGQYQAIKYLFEMVGIYPAVAGEAEEPDDCLSQVLLQHLGIGMSEGAQLAVDPGDVEMHPVE
jgi:hypothetical protein